MIRATKPDGSPVLINPEQILFIEEAGDTVITFADRHVFIVSEPLEEINAQFDTWHRATHPCGADGATHKPVDAQNTEDVD